jgi:KUP system potassium uptake protein
VPVALAKNVKHNRIIHTRTILLHFRVEDVPRVPNLEKITIEKLGSGFHRIIARYGFMENPALDNALALARGQDLDLDMENTSFYLGCTQLVIGEIPKMARWRANMFFSCLTMPPMRHRFSTFRRTRSLKLVCNWRFNGQGEDQP